MSRRPFDTTLRTPTDDPPVSEVIPAMNAAVLRCSGFERVDLYADNIAGSSPKAIRALGLHCQPASVEPPGWLGMAAVTVEALAWNHRVGLGSSSL